MCDVVANKHHIQPPEALIVSIDRERTETINNLPHIRTGSVKNEIQTI